LNCGRLLPSSFTTGSVGGPEWGAGLVRPEQGILDLRKSLNLYANIRPALFPSESLVSCSPLKEEFARGTEVIVLRENAGGIYFGEKIELPKGAREGFARDTCDYSVHEVERIARVAGLLARTHNPPYTVHSIDKANVMASSRLWRNVVTDLFAREFPDLELRHQLADSAATVLASRPNKLNGILLGIASISVARNQISTLLTFLPLAPLFFTADNLFGDMLSDEVCGLLSFLQRVIFFG
jgi:3-isopropylmalate dehydrogenase